MGRNVAEAARALLHLRLGHGARLIARLELRVRRHDEEVEDSRDDYEGDQHVDEIAVQELAVIGGEVETREVRLAEEGSDDGGYEVLDESCDYCAESDPD